MGQIPIKREILESILAKNSIESIASASIREVQKIIDGIESVSGVKFVRMEVGVPGLRPNEIATEAQIEALRNGVAAKYPNIQGLPELKEETAKFCKNFMNIDVSPEACVPTCGSMQAGFALFMNINRMFADREGTLFIDPGFPVQKTQCEVLGQAYRSFDVYNFRGQKLRAKLEEMLSDGKTTSLLYSNPNNPAWICLTEEELKIIAEVADKYNVIVIEDLAYFGMDFRCDYSNPGEAPYQPTIARYMDNYVIMMSSSKIFSYAGERIGMMIVSDKLWNTKAPDLLRYYKSDVFGNAMIFGAIYTLSSGVSHSAQYALSAILKAANEGKINLTHDVKEYERRAIEMKRIFTDNGFKIVYDKDGDTPIADGFYFTLSYPGLDADGLINEMALYGVSAISLKTTGSERTEGLRACVSHVNPSQFGDLEMRMKQFHADHPIR